MSTNSKKPALGDTVKHTITGFEGVVVAFTTWLNGCERLSVQPTKMTKEGKPHDSAVFDIQELVVTKAGTHAATPAPSPEAPVRRTGGDRPNVGRGQKTPERR